jgi:glycine/D-amino acid oxidase-like deaminating enzyme
LFIREGKKIMNGLQWEIDASWAGYYSQCKQDKIFNQEIEPNIHVVTGIGGKGMTASPGYALENINRIYHD